MGFDLFGGGEEILMVFNCILLHASKRIYLPCCAGALLTCPLKLSTHS